MLSRSRLLWLSGVGYLLLYAVCLLATSPYRMAVSYPFQLLAAWFTFAVCLRRATITPSQTQFNWAMVSAGIFLWATGISFAAWEDLSQHLPGTTAYLSDFLYLLYGVPILLTISSPTGSEKNAAFLSLDAVQAILTVCLIHVSLFSSFPFLNQEQHPIPAALVLKTYNAQNLILACGATLRLIAQRRQGEVRHFYQILTAFLWSYAICAAVYNYRVISDLATQGQPGLYDLLVVAPFLLLAACALLPPVQSYANLDAAGESSLTLFIDNACPIFYTLALLALGLFVIRPHLYLGTFSIAIAFVVYGLRSTLLQTRYVRSQEALREARDRLEEISLTDGLTRVANRRRFDQVLEIECDRASRLKHPLSLLLIDVDYFKHLNDQYGHRRGDQCLVEIAGALRDALVRSNDLLARYGGEEFAAILADANYEGAYIVAKRMQASVRELKIRNETTLGEFATISIGIATLNDSHESVGPTALIEAADRALYLAKQRGRNRVEYLSMQALSMRIQSQT